MKTLLALVAASALLFCSNSHAQELGGTGPATSIPQIPRNSITLWPFEPTQTMEMPPLEGLTLPPNWTPGEQGGLPESWPSALGWSPSEGLPSLQDWVPPEGWSPEDWQRVSEEAYLVPLIQGGATVIAVLFGVIESRGFCWYEGPHTEGAVRNQQVCVCRSYLLGLFRSCTWETTSP